MSTTGALIVKCVAPEGLLRDHTSKGSLIAAIGGTIKDYRLCHKGVSNVWNGIWTGMMEWNNGTDVCVTD